MNSLEYKIGYLKSSIYMSELVIKNLRQAGIKPDLQGGCLETLLSVLEWELPSDKHKLEELEKGNKC